MALLLFSVRSSFCRKQTLLGKVFLVKVVFADSQMHFLRLKIKQIYISVHHSPAFE